MNAGWYQVTVPAGTLTAFTEGNADTYMEIYNSSAQLIAVDDDSGNGFNPRISITVPAGTYLIRVTYLSGSGLYVLHVTR